MIAPKVDLIELYEVDEVALVTCVIEGCDWRETTFDWGTTSDLYRAHWDEAHSGYSLVCRYCKRPIFKTQAGWCHGDDGKPAGVMCQEQPDEWVATPFGEAWPV